jgi:hypothetical protein
MSAPTVTRVHGGEHGRGDHEELDREAVSWLDSRDG